MSSRPDPIATEPIDARPLTAVCAWARAQAAPLALGMLDADEAGRVYDHLLLCPACDEAVQRLVSMTSLIGLTVEQVEPPIGARQALLTRAVQGGYDRRVARRGSNSLAAIAAIRGWHPTLTANRWFAPIAVLFVLVLGSFGVQSAFSSSDEVAKLRREKASMVAHAQLISIAIGRQKFGDDALFYPLMAIDDGETGAGGVLLGDPFEPRASLSIWSLIEEPGDYTVTLESLDGTLSAAGAVTIDQRGVGALDLHLFQPIVTYRVVHVATTAEPNVDVFTLRLDQSSDLVQQLGET